MDQNFDLSKYELQETASLKIRNAKDDDYLRGIDGEPVVFELYGPGSEQYARATHVMSNKATVRAQAAIRGKAVTNHVGVNDLLTIGTNLGFGLSTLGQFLADDVLFRFFHKLLSFRLVLEF